MLKQRVITAIVLLFVLGSILLSGHQPLFIILVCLFISAAYWEALRLLYAPPSDHRYQRGVVGAAIFSSCLLIYLLFATPNPMFMRLSWLMNSGIWLLMFTPLVLFSNTIKRIPVFSLGLAFPIVLFANATALLQAYDRGVIFLLTLMALVWIADIGAYMCGKMFGKHKLAPHISPGKTIEGALGGMALCVLWTVVSAIFIPSSFGAALVQSPWGWLGAIALTICLCAISIVGDLFESLLKRRAGRKDSSQLLPGHGGVYDRIDALLPVLPLALLLC